MVKWRWFGWIFLITGLMPAAFVWAEQAGSIRGMVHDSDFDAPLAAAQVSIAETNETVATTDEGNFVFGQVEPGTYTLVFSKDGYTRQVKADVVVSPGQMTEANASLSGEFEEMEEFVVQDVQIGTGTEAALLDLRMESPALMDSISADLMSQAGAGDAASALRLVSGATVQDGKYATIRGLPDRYVNSQMNGVRLPSADADKRAVQLDQFPSAVIESIQVTKTFTPDQQGDASGGAVNVVLKGIPNETLFKFDIGTSYNTQVKKAGSDFLASKGGGVNFWGKEDRNIPVNLGDYDAAGVSRGDEPTDYKWSMAAGGKHEFKDGLKLGAFGSFFYERDSSFYDDGIDDKYLVETPGAPMTPQTAGDSSNLTTSLFDVTQATQSVQWGGLGVLGLEYEEHSLNLLYMYTHAAEDKATLAEDTRGKAYFFPGYNPDDINDEGNSSENRSLAPYLRTETLTYTERTTQTLQLHGKHTLADLDFGIENVFTFLSPELDWTLAKSSSELYQPDKRQFGSKWLPDSLNPGAPPYLPPFTEPAVYLAYKPGVNSGLGYFQRIWKDITEESNQYSLNLKLPFEQWSGDEGYLKFGLFNDEVTRDYNQDTFQFADESITYNAPWNASFSEVFSGTPVESDFDVDYQGQQNISAWYYMADIPLNSYFNIIGGTRFERTELSIKNDPDPSAKWIVPGSSGPSIYFDPAYTDVTFEQTDMLPSLGFEFKPLDSITLRGSYAETVARQTFKELSPIQQMEYLGGDVFVGNPELKMSSLKNYDLRLDWTPYQGGLISVSHFRKKIKDPIEYVKGNAGYDYTYSTNYPEGKLSGFEIEIRQQLGRFWEDLDGLSLGTNATFINSEVSLPDDEAQDLVDVGKPEPTRDMANAPEHLYNFYVTYDIQKTGTQLGLFYTVRGDTLLAGAKGSSGGGLYIPDVYETEYGTLNFSASQKLGEIWTLKFQAKNLLDPEIQTVYRSKYIGDDVRKTSYTKGMDFSISLSATF